MPSIYADIGIYGSKGTFFAHVSGPESLIWSAPPIPSSTHTLFGKYLEVYFLTITMNLLLLLTSLSLFQAFTAMPTDYLKGYANAGRHFMMFIHNAFGGWTRYMWDIVANMAEEERGNHFSFVF